MRLTIWTCAFLLLGTAAPHTAWAVEPPPGMSDAEFATLSEEVRAALAERRGALMLCGSVYRNLDDSLILKVGR